MCLCQAEKRYKVVEEIIQTERSYVDQLMCIVNLRLAPLRNSLYAEGDLNNQFS